jgi:hypothetical protein
LFPARREFSFQRADSRRIPDTGNTIFPVEVVFVCGCSEELKAAMANK